MAMICENYVCACRVCPTGRIVANIRESIPEILLIAPDAEGIAGDEASGRRIEVTRAVVIEARFGIAAAAGEEGRVADGTIGQRRAGAVEERRQAVISVAVLFNNNP